MATSRVGFSGGPSVTRRGCGRQTCQMCIAGAKWLPVLLIMAIVSWSYYAYIVHLCVFTVLNEAGTIEAIILATIYHLFLVPFLASYWKTVWTHPGKVNVTFLKNPFLIGNIISFRIYFFFVIDWIFLDFLRFHGIFSVFYRISQKFSLFFHLIDGIFFPILF